MTLMSLDTSLVVPDDVIFRELDGEAIILNLSTGTYFGLDAIGARMWMLFARSEPLERVVGALADEYDVDRATLERDVIDLVSELMTKGLVQTKTAGSHP